MPVHVMLSLELMAVLTLKSFPYLFFLSGDLSRSICLHICVHSQAINIRTFT